MKLGLYSVWNEVPLRALLNTVVLNGRVTEPLEEIKKYLESAGFTAEPETSSPMPFEGIISAGQIARVYRKPLAMVESSAGPRNGLDSTVIVGAAVIGDESIQPRKVRDDIERILNRGGFFAESPLRIMVRDFGIFSISDNFDLRRYASANQLFELFEQVGN